MGRDRDRRPRGLGECIRGGRRVHACSSPRIRWRRSARLPRRGSTGSEQGGCRVVGITGSTGKTSTKDILLALARPPFGGRVHANRENFNTEVGLPLTVLEAEEGTDLIVLEMAMRGMGQIRDLARIARPDVGVITNVGPVHLELVGTVERVAEAKAELIARAGAGRGVRRAGRGGGAAVRTCAPTCGS